MTKLEVGTIVRLMDSFGPEVLAVVIEDTHGVVASHRADAFTRVLQGPCSGRAGGIEANGGWFIDSVNESYPYAIVPDDEVPDELLALATRCVLDPTFVPEIEE